MTAKRFKLYEHKHIDYIIDNPHEHLDFIEMIGDALTSEEIVDLLNRYDEKCKMYRKDALKAEKDKEILLDENERLKQQLRIFSDGLKAEIRETTEVFEDYSECVDEKLELKKENEQLKSFIKKLTNYNGEILLMNGYGYTKSYLEKLLNEKELR